MTTRIRSAKAFLQLVRPPRPIEDVLSSIPSVSPWIAGLLRAVDEEAPGVIERAIDRVPLTRARALDSSQETSRSDHYETLCKNITSTIDRKSDLVRVSLHVPREADRDLAPSLHAYAGQIAELGDGHGVLLAIDRRDDGSEHAHGIVACDHDKRPTLIETWCALTHASPTAHRGAQALKSISGWHHFAMTGDSTLLQPNLRRVVAYSLHDLPGGAVRDLEHDVVAAGVLAAPWNAFRESDATAASTRAERLRGYTRGVPRPCDVCGQSIAAKKRRDAKTCSTTCRMSKRDRKKMRT